MHCALACAHASHSLHTARLLQTWLLVPPLLLLPSIFTDTSRSTISRAQTSKYGAGCDERWPYLPPAVFPPDLHQLMRLGTDACLRCRLSRPQSRGSASAGQGARAFPALAAAQLLQRARQSIRLIDIYDLLYKSHARCRSYARAYHCCSCAAMTLMRTLIH